MSGTGKRGADKLNIIGVVVVGLCGAILTYVAIVGLEAYYMNETSAIERTKAHEAPNSLRNRIKDLQAMNLDGTKEGTISIAEAEKLVVQDAQRDPAVLIPGKPSIKPTVEPQYGRPATLPAPPPPPPPATDPTTTPPATDPAATPSSTAPATDPATAPAATPTTTPETTPAAKTMTPEEAKWWAEHGQQPPATTPTTTPAATPATSGGNGP